MSTEIRWRRRTLVTRADRKNPGMIITDRNRTRYYQVQKDGSIRRIEKPEGVA